MSTTAIIPDRPDLTPQFEFIYKIAGVELNFGEFTEGETPTLSHLVTYIKQ